MIRKIVGVAAVALFAAGCAMQPTVPGTSVRWDERRNTLLELDEWQARGRIAVKYGKDGGQGNIQWQQTGAEARIRLNGPFGAGAYELLWNDEQVTITDKNGVVSADYAGPDAAERLISERVGWTFPADSTRFWILGVANPEFPARMRFDTEGWLSAIEQNGWVIAYDGFADRFGTWMPRRIVMENDQARLRVVVDRWLF